MKRRKFLKALAGGVGALLVAPQDLFRESESSVVLMSPSREDALDWWTNRPTSRYSGALTMEDLRRTWEDCKKAAYLPEYIVCRAEDRDRILAFLGSTA